MKNPYIDKAQASILEWMTEDQMLAQGVDHTLVIERGPDGRFTERAERISDLFWAMMAFGNYELTLEEDAYENL